jgi:hypothetical protein
MKLLTPLLIFILLILSCSVWKGNHEDTAKELAQAFENPPSSARPGVFWC